MQAYELSLIRGRVDEGREMEERRVVDGTTGGARGRLLRWEGGQEGGKEGEVWVDRYVYASFLVRSHWRGMLRVSEPGECKG